MKSILKINQQRKHNVMDSIEQQKLATAVMALISGFAEVYVDKDINGTMIMLDDSSFVFDSSGNFHSASIHEAK